MPTFQLVNRTSEAYPVMFRNTVAHDKPALSIAPHGLRRQTGLFCFSSAASDFAPASGTWRYVTLRTLGISRLSNHRARNSASAKNTNASEMASTPLRLGARYRHILVPVSNALNW